jgi:maltose alpha-D-glucosyltransferase/alpha-amylase
LKLFRRIEEGFNPELEIGRFLTEKAHFAYAPPVAGALEYHTKNGSIASLAILQGLIPNEGDAWQYTLDHLGRYFQRALAHQKVQVPPLPYKSILLLGSEIPPLAQEIIGPYLASVQLLGERTAELHKALASSLNDPDFAPERFSLLYQNSICQAMRSYTINTFELLRQRLKDLPEEIRENAEDVLQLENEIVGRYQLIRGRKFNAARIRCHGDYHLGQVLYTGKDFVIIDFEGEPARPISERRLKRSPLRDIAGMIRSFDYATHTALMRQSLLAQSTEDLDVLDRWGRFWYTWVSAAFLSSYLKFIKYTQLLPDNFDELKPLLDAFLLDKAMYEIGYELNNRPEWVKIPIHGILEFMEIE